MATSATILAFRLSDSTRSPIATLAQSRTRSVNRHQYPAVNHTYSSGDDVFITQALPETLSLALIYGCGGGLLEFSAEENGNDLDGDFGGSDGSILPPPPSQMLPDEGFALREWRRLNAMRLEEKSRIFKP